MDTCTFVWGEGGGGGISLTHAIALVRSLHYMIKAIFQFRLSIIIFIKDEKYLVGIPKRLQKGQRATAAPGGTHLTRYIYIIIPLPTELGVMRVSCMHKLVYEENFEK